MITKLLGAFFGLFLMLISAPMWGMWEGRVMSWDFFRRSDVPRVFLLSEITCVLYFVGFLIFMPHARQVFGEDKAITLLVLSAGLWEVVNIIWAIFVSSRGLSIRENIVDILVIVSAFFVLLLAAGRIEDRIF